jgi:TolB-like protein
MTQPSVPSSEGHATASPVSATATRDSEPAGLWARLKEHKVAEWTLAYAAAAYTLLHCVEMVSEAMEWPHVIARITTLVLALAAPLVATLAWYHGARALKRISGPELAIITILLVIAGGVLWVLGRGGIEHATTQPVPNTAARAPALPVSVAPATAIAVMPFVNLTGDPSKDYLGDGMAEEVINTLTTVPGLQVPARTSSFAYKGRNVDIRQVARDLNVGTVLEGSVRSAGDTIRITAQLIDARSGLHIWSRTYDKKFTDLFRLQDELATAITEALRVSLNGGATPLIAQASSTRDVQAYDLYMQALSIMLRSTEQGLHLALDLYDQALARDPTFARALAARSRARVTFLVRGYPLANARDDAERDARRALALDPMLAVAHQALGNVSAMRADWSQAEASYRAALAIDSNDPDMHSGYAMVILAPSGRLRESLAEGTKAYSLAPASPRHIGIASSLDLYAGRDAEAIKYARLAEAVGGLSVPQVDRFTAARRANYTEAADRAIGALSPAMRSAGGAEAVRLVYAALAEPARRPVAQRALQTLLDQLGPEHLTPNDRRELIFDFCLLDARDQAYELAERYLHEFLLSGTGGGADWRFLWLPEMRSFREDPRFERFTQRLGLLEYWRVHGPPDDCDLTSGKLLCH